MAAQTRNQRKAARRAARDGKAAKKGAAVSSQAMRTLEAFAFDRDVTRFLKGERPCPYCGANLQTTHSLDERSAQPGAFTVCLKCSGICRFDAEMKLHAVSDAEVEALPPEARKVLEELQALVRHVKLEHGRTRTRVEA